ncbi:MAG: DUF4179 domain-containing protein [Oscillospiraceae bacterium]
MRSTDERMAAVGRRTRELKQQQKLRHRSIAGLSATLGALALVVGAAFAMPGIMTRMNVSEYLGSNGMASIFSVDSRIGYVMISLLAFALGVCVTTLCLHLHQAAKKRNPHEETEERQDD